jgi:hypothetical protein
MSFDYVMDLLRRLDRSDPMRFDPSGHDRLRDAKRIRREHLRMGGEEAVAEQANQHFILPATSEPMSLQLAAPLFPPHAEQASYRARSA